MRPLTDATCDRWIPAVAIARIAPNTTVINLSIGPPGLRKVVASASRMIQGAVWKDGP